MPKVSFCVCKWVVITNAASGFPDIVSGSAASSGWAGFSRLSVHAPAARFPDELSSGVPLGWDLWGTRKKLGLPYLIKQKQSACGNHGFVVSNKYRKWPSGALKLCLWVLPLLIFVDPAQFPGDESPFHVLVGPWQNSWGWRAPSLVLCPGSFSCTNTTCASLYSWFGNHSTSKAWFDVSLWVSVHLLAALASPCPRGGMGSVGNVLHEEGAVLRGVAEALISQRAGIWLEV